jgi:xanthosine utilization system XapX-like protein
VALAGLLGIPLDEQVLPALRRVLARERIGIEWIKTGCVPPILGRLPQPEKREMQT